MTEKSLPMTLPFALSDRRDAGKADAVYVSENMRGRVVISDYDPMGNTVVLMHRAQAGQDPAVGYDLTDEGDLRLRLPRGEVVLRGVRHPGEVRMVLRPH